MRAGQAISATMPKKCSKRLSALTWALFECMFFSSIVVGWTWLTIVFRTDGYFTDTCNVTFVNVTPSGRHSASGAERNLAGSRPGEERGKARKRPCRSRRESFQLNSHAVNRFIGEARQEADIPVEKLFRTNGTSVKVASHGYDAGLIIHPRADNLNSGGTKRETGINSSKGHPEIRLRKVKVYEAFRETADGLFRSNTSQHVDQLVVPPQAGSERYTWSRGHHLPPQVFQVARLQQGAATANQGR